MHTPPRATPSQASILRYCQSYSYTPTKSQSQSSSIFYSSRFHFLCSTSILDTSPSCDQILQAFYLNSPPQAIVYRQTHRYVSRLGHHSPGHRTKPQDAFATECYIRSSICLFAALLQTGLFFSQLFTPELASYLTRSRPHPRSRYLSAALLCITPTTSSPILKQQSSSSVAHFSAYIQQE